MHSIPKSNMFDDGFMELNKDLAEAMKWADEKKKKDAQEAGASFLVNKVRQLSKPRRKGKLLESVDYEYNPAEKSTDAGWKVYYGRIVENGHKAGARPSRSKRNKIKDTRTYVPAQPHLFPTYNPL